MTGETAGGGSVPGGEADTAEAQRDAGADSAEASTDSETPRDNPIRRLYDWVLHWAETPYGVPALFIIALAESSFFPLPPDPLLLALCLGASKRSLKFAGVATLASVVGGVIGYGIGAGGWHIVQDWFFAYVPGVTPEAFEGVREFYDRHGFAAVFLAGLTPIPYKVFTLASGVFGINLGVFVLASILSRGFRFFVIAGLVYRFGPPIERFIDLHFNKLVLFFSLLFVGGFLAIEFLM